MSGEPAALVAIVRSVTPADVRQTSGAGRTAAEQQRMLSGGRDAAVARTPIG
jgi:hypothetical protein